MNVTPGKAILIGFAGFAAKSGAAAFDGFERVEKIVDLHLAVSPLDITKTPEDFLMGFCGTTAGVTDEGPEEGDAEILVRAFMEVLQESPSLARLLAAATAEECTIAMEQAGGRETLTDDDIRTILAETDGTLQG
jgi:hypothetical protein